MTPLFISQGGADTDLLSAPYGLRVNLFQDKTYADQHNPELRLVTHNIEAVYNKVKTTHPGLLHPNLSQITLRPWGAREFALTDKQIGIVIQQW